MKIVSIINMIGVLGIAAFLFYNKMNEKKIVYVNNGELLAGFKMSVESSNDVKEIEIAKQAVLDSLLNEIKMVTNVKDKETIEKLKTTYVSKRKSYSEELSRVKQSVTERVATQINQYVRDFSEENKYDIVLGANGSANIWYSVEKNDITKELIAYANKKYDNKKN